MESNFIKTIIENDIKSGKHTEIITRFPPEPNGFLHIGHARAIIINFELAKAFGGKTYLRFDDTNPSNENMEYVNSAIEDIKWLGYEPAAVFFASDYFDFMFEKALVLIKKGLAYVDRQTAEEISLQRGNIQKPGINSPYRDTPIEENLHLFLEMKAGKFQPGEMVLRAKIDMSSPNMNMRDPAIYRITNQEHFRKGKNWCIYPLYDFAHPLEDVKEGITHSLCSLEFEDHRPLYNWVVENTECENQPRQIEFGRLNIENTVLSKRYLKALVENNLVSGWDDPRMPTIKGLKKKGYSPESIRAFILGAGLSKTNADCSREMLDSFVRSDLMETSARLNAIIDPLEVEITNFPEGELETIKVPVLEGKAERDLYFSKHLYIDKADFLKEKPNRQWKRLYIGGEVRLMNAYFIKCEDVVLNKAGEVIKLLCTYDPKTKSGSGFDERKPNGTINFVEKTTAKPATFFFTDDLIDNSKEGDLIERFNRSSLVEKHGFAEPFLTEVAAGEVVQFIRQGFFSKQQIKDNSLEFVETVKLKSNFKK